MERLDHQKWTEFIQTHCDILLKEVELEPSIDRDKINMDITDLIKIKCISQGRVFMSLYSPVIYNTYITLLESALSFHSQIFDVVNYFSMNTLLNKKFHPRLESLFDRPKMIISDSDSVLTR